MTLLQRIALSGLAAFLLVPAFASAATASVINLSSASPMAKTSVTFNLALAGFSTPYYQIADSFPNSTVNSQNLNFGGNFQWTPSVSDVGTHTITITVNDSTGNNAVVTQTITVMPPPSITIQSVNPTGAIMPGTRLTFQVVQNGFSSPNYIVSDSFSGTTVNNSAIDGSGNFSWTPDTTQNGDHVITVSAYDSAGHSSDVHISVRVGAGPSLGVPSGVTWTLSPGQLLNFTLVPTAYTPTGFTISDKFSGAAPSTLTGASVNTNGLVMWTPSASDAGVHTVTFTGQVGFYGQTASVTQVINVLGPNGTVPGAVTTTAATSTTASSSGASVNDLLAKLAALQSQAGGASSAPGLSVAAFTLYLKQGSENREVTALQTLLKKLGFMSVAANGYFGPSTKAALMAYQKARGLDQLGVVGPSTRAALNADAGASTQTVSTTSAGGSYTFEHFMGVGDDDPDVLQLQNKLAALGYLSATPNGTYGAATEAAVKKFQAAHGLPQTGYVASNTRAALNAN